MSWVQMLFGGYRFECVLVVSWSSVILGLYFQMAFGGYRFECV